MNTEAKHQPTASGYAESKPTGTPPPQRDQPDPEAAGGQRAQVAAGNTRPDEEQAPQPVAPDPLPPGEHKREPIKDPDPADTKLHVQQSSR
jgi:hypothetical protein